MFKLFYIHGLKTNKNQSKYASLSSSNIKKCKNVQNTGFDFKINILQKIQVVNHSKKTIKLCTNIVCQCCYATTDWSLKLLAPSSKKKYKKNVPGFIF